MKFFVLALFFMVSCSSNNTKSYGDDFAPEYNSEDSIENISINSDENFVLGTQKKSKKSSVDLASVKSFGSYTVEPGDTLMLVAFKIYGDYLKWREIKRANPQISSTELIPGTTLNFVKSGTFVWKRNGNPHLIKWGETLGSISGMVYGKKHRWPEIFDNNRPMIKDPNLIFAGFTLYYVPDRI